MGTARPGLFQKRASPKVERSVSTMMENIVAGIAREQWLFGGPGGPTFVEPMIVEVNHTLGRQPGSRIEWT